MKPTHSKKIGLAAALAAVTVLAGCELIVDFDRSKIPVADTDSGVVNPPVDSGLPETSTGGDSGSDSSTGNDSGGSDAAGDAPATD